MELLLATFQLPRPITYHLLLVPGLPRSIRSESTDLTVITILTSLVAGCGSFNWLSAIFATCNSLCVKGRLQFVNLCLRNNEHKFRVIPFSSVSWRAFQYGSLSLALSCKLRAYICIDGEFSIEMPRVYDWMDNCLEFHHILTLYRVWMCNNNFVKRNFPFCSGWYYFLLI